MAISETLRRSPLYFGNGSTTEFAFHFKVFKPEHLLVLRFGPSEPDAGTELTLGEEYDVDLSNDPNEPGGKVVFGTAPSGSVRIRILSGQPFDQTLTLFNQGPYFAEDVMGALDRNTILTQQLREWLLRTPSLPPGDDETDPQELFTIVQNSAQTAQAAADAAATSEGNAADSATAAAGSATNAADSATAASDSASAASTSESNAADSATAAAGSATTAGDAATTAIGARDKAEEWADNDEDVEVEPGRFSAFHWSRKAQSFAEGDATNISYDNTVSGLAATDVQDALDEVSEAQNAIKEAAVPPAFATTGDGAAYVLDPGADLRRTALDVYDQYVFRANADSTGAVTLDVTLADSTTGAIAVQRYVGDTLTALAAGDLVEGHHYAVQYDGAVWVLMTQLSAPSLSEAQATDPDDTTFGTVSGQRLAQARGAVVAPVEITSGDTIDFTAIPDHVREITLHFWGAVTSSNDDFHVQLVVGGTPITSGYTSAGVGFGSTSSNASGNSSSAFVLRRLNDSEVISGAAVLKKIGSNRWSFSAAGSRGIGVFLGGGHGDAGGVVDGLRILTAGSDTFSGGFWALEYRK